MSDVAPLRERGTWQGKKNTFRTTHVSQLTFPFLGVANMFFACGQAVGAPVGGLIADTIGWRWYAEQSLSPISI